MAGWENIPVPRDNIEIDIGVGEEECRIYVVEQLGLDVVRVYQTVPVHEIVRVRPQSSKKDLVTYHRPSRALDGKLQTAAAMTSSPEPSPPIPPVISSEAPSEGW